MDDEYHYWITGIIAHQAGFTESEAQTIAYSSQYVDDNCIGVKVQDEDSNSIFANHISQTINILKPKRRLMRIYPIFHFVPGDPLAESARRRDGKMHILTTTPGSRNVNRLLDRAFHADDVSRLYRIGIATHAYADSWAHQNFIGWFDDFNAVGDNVIPNIGHTDIQHEPDIVGNRWIDNRILDKKIDNNRRYAEASKALFNRYRNYLIGMKRYTEADAPRWEDFENDLMILLATNSKKRRKSNQKKRIGRYKAFAPWLEEYDELKWFNAAVKTKVRGMRDMRSDFLKEITLFRDEYRWRDPEKKHLTDWYKFQAAVKENVKYGIELLRPIFEQMNVDIVKA